MTDNSLQFLFTSIIAKSKNTLITPSLNKVTGNFAHIHLEGSWQSQLAQACIKFGYQWRIIGRDVRIAPNNSNLVDRIAIISDDNVKFNFPHAVPYGLEINTWFDQTIIYGQRVQLETSVARWVGEYNIIGMHIIIGNNTDKWYNKLQLTKSTF